MFLENAQGTSVHALISRITNYGGRRLEDFDKSFTPCRRTRFCGVEVRTGGHFACACVNPLNDNSVRASNLMAGNRKLARKIAILLKAISLVL